MIERHPCKAGEVVVTHESGSDPDGFDWNMTLYDDTGMALAGVRTPTLPNFCSWCGLSLKET